MAKKRNTITNVKLEINGELYETDNLSSDDCGCNECQLQEYCGAHDELYKFCTHLGWNMYFKKVDKKIAGRSAVFSRVTCDWKLHEKIVKRPVVKKL